MTIFGVGVDIVSVDRVARIFEKFPESFPRRVLSEAEWVDFEQVGNQAGFLARRFAAKEAVAKALGTGICETLGFSDISIGHDARGRPHVRLSALSRERLCCEELAFHISISDERHYAIAYVLAALPEKAPNASPLRGSILAPPSGYD